MAVSKKRTPQVTCNCTAYKFPHRLGGGKCTATEWCASYQELDGFFCPYCSCNNNSESGAQGSRFGTCDVQEGLESVELCDGYQDYLHSDTPIRLPMTLEDYLSEHMGE